MAGPKNGAVSAQEDGKSGSGAAATAHQLPLFEMSSQFRTWRYSADGLAKARADLNAAAVGRVRSMLQEEKEEADASKAPAPDEVQYLTVSDELSLVAYYLAQLVRLCKAFKFPIHVESTAMTFLKRFYLRNTCMDYHPKNVMLTCLFLAAKSENCLIGIDAFTSRIPNCEPADVLSLEFLVAQSIKFQLKVHHADLAGRGMMLDMQTLLDDENDLSYLLDQVYPKAHSTILLLRLTDAEFIYTPSQIALAAFHVADPSLTERWLRSKLELADSSTLRKPATEDERMALDSILRDIVDPIVDLVEQGKKAVDIEAVREVDKRLKFCTNPEKDPNSKLYKKRERQKEEELVAKAKKKYEDKHKMDVDPFE